MAGAVLAMSNAILTSDDFQILNPPIPGVVTHPRQDLGRVSHSSQWYRMRYHRVGMNGPQCMGLVLLVAAVGFAQTDETKCGGTTYDISVCLSAILKGVEADLSEVYQRALKTTSEFYRGKDTQNLKAAQARWIAHRDATCKAEYGLFGGASGGTNTFTACEIRLTRQRIADLAAAYGKK